MSGRRRRFRPWRCLAERARIARELHDVVAHHISIIAVQAETARLSTRGLPDRRRASGFAAIAGTARAALDRDAPAARRAAQATDADRPELAPQPGLGQLDDLLVERAGRRGRRHASTVSGRVPARRRASSCRPTGSCRRRSPTCAGTRPGAAVAWCCATAHDALRVGVTRRRARAAREPRPAGHGLARDAGAGGRRSAARWTPAPRPAAGSPSPPSSADRGADSVSRSGWSSPTTSVVRAGFAGAARRPSRTSTVVGEAADGRRRCGCAAATAARRRADGRAHARHGRHRGDPPASLAGRPDRRRGCSCSPRSTSTSTSTTRSRAGASGFLLKDATAERPGRRGAGRRRRRRAARADRDPPADRRVRPPAPDAAPPAPDAGRADRRGSARCCG